MTYHFQVVHKYKRIIERIEGTDPPTEMPKCYAVNALYKTRGKNKVEWFIFLMKVDMDSDVILIPRNNWK